MKTTIKWNADLFGVEIEGEDMHFVIDAHPSYAMSWHDAVRFYTDNKVWQLPTRKQLELIAENIDEVNDLIKANGGYEMYSYHWTADADNEFCAWRVDMYDGYTISGNKYNYDYVRAVSAL